MKQSDLYRAADLNRQIESLRVKLRMVNSAASFTIQNSDIMEVLKNHDDSSTIGPAFREVRAALASMYEAQIKHLGRELLALGVTELNDGDAK